METPSKILNLLDTFSSVSRSFWMTEKAASLRPETLSHFMFPNVLEVVETRSCEALIHSADALPVGTARKAVAMRTTAQDVSPLALPRGPKEQQRKLADQKRGRPA